jgi:phenylacetate-CoA ligase
VLLKKAVSPLKTLNRIAAASAGYKNKGSNMSTHFDALETRSPEQREADLFARLPKLIAHAQEHAPGWKRHLQGVDAQSVTSRSALQKLPVLRKSELKDLQAATPPFGGLATKAPGFAPRIFMSPGPIFEPQPGRTDPWRVARALFAAGIRPGNIIQNCFGYHLTPGAWMVDEGARHLGCAVIPAGIGQTEQQLEVINALKPDAYVGTPSFLRILIEKAQELNVDISNLKNALCAAEALPPSLRQWFVEQGLNRVLQFYGTAELGCVAYESEAMEGMIVDEDCLIEVVLPGTGDPVAAGQVGELVVTCLNDDYPMIRFGTGDLTAVLPGISPCGRTNTRIKGWMGRADQTTKIRGMFVHPGQVAEVMKRHVEIKRARMVISGEMANDEMTLRCEVADINQLALNAAIADSIRSVTKLRANVEFVAIGSLANDGKLIEDARSYK